MTHPRDTEEAKRLDRQAHAYEGDGYELEELVKKTIARQDAEFESLSRRFVRCQEQVAKLLEACKDAAKRMSRARDILASSNTTPGNWGILDASDIYAAIKESEGE